MSRCLELALLSAGMTAPNPMVGSVIIHDNKIIGEGFHHALGEAHAEVNAINDVFKNNLQHLLEKATLYVNLEPCNHFGKTPPCTDLIINHKIPNVVIGCEDPFPLVNGNGLKKLIEEGLNVKTGIMQKECSELNKRFFTFHQNKRPFIILKYAQTSNHYIASKKEGEKKISNECSDILVHRWRSEESAVMVGTRTALADNPLLTVRKWKGRNPVRIVLDKLLTLPENLQLFDGTASTIVFNALKNYKGKNLELIQINFDQEILTQILRLLYKRNILSILVEGGTNLLNQFIQNNLWDEARIITSEKSFEDGIRSPLIHGRIINSMNVENDRITFLSPN
jgi:diaminohydroxyphosphoribosylaminopyrimidine deaminase/5-amino-6-(5-phosphoribosylamino)uracil reductase